MTRRPGPRIAIDPDLQTRIMSLVRAGAYPERAAAAEGVSSSTHYRWQAKGLEEREHREAGGRPRKTMAAYLGYVDALDQAIAQAEVDLVKEARNAENRGAALQILERRFRERWAVKPPSSPRSPVAAPRTPLDALAERRAQRDGDGPASPRPHV